MKHWYEDSTELFNNHEVLIHNYDAMKSLKFDEFAV